MAERAVQVARLGGAGEAATKRDLWLMVLISNLTVFAARGHRALDALASDLPQELIEDARQALESLDCEGLAHVASAIAQAIPNDAIRSDDRVEAVASLQFVATRVASHRSTMRHLRRSMPRRCPVTLLFW